MLSHAILRPMATLEREEGDYTYWSDGAQRYAKGNSLGKAPGSLAKRHPKAATSFDKLPLSKVKAMASNGGRGKYAARRRAITEAHAYALSSTHPDLHTEQDGLRELAESSFLQAKGEQGGPAVKAREQFFQEYTGGRQETQATEEHKHLHITISPGVEVEQRDMMKQLMDVVEGEARDVGDGGDDGGG